MQMEQSNLGYVRLTQECCRARLSLIFPDALPMGLAHELLLLLLDAHL